MIATWSLSYGLDRYDMGMSTGSDSILLGNKSFMFETILRTIRQTDNPSVPQYTLLLETRRKLTGKVLLPVRRSDPFKMGSSLFFHIASCQSVISDRMKFLPQSWKHMMDISKRSYIG